jgi:hypothetical protein
LAEWQRYASEQLNIMSFGDVIVMPLEAVEDLYGDHGDTFNIAEEEVLPLQTSLTLSDFELS